MKIALHKNAMLASFWDELTGDSNGITLMILIIAAVAALALIVTVLILFCRRSRIVLNLGDGKVSVIKTGRYKAVTLPTPKKEGDSFGGWYADKEFTKEVSSPFQAKAALITLFAKWVNEEAEVVAAEQEKLVAAEEPVAEEKPAEDTQAAVCENPAAEEPSEGEPKAETAEEPVVLPEDVPGQTEEPIPEEISDMQEEPAAVGEVETETGEEPAAAAESETVTEESVAEEESVPAEAQLAEEEPEEEEDETETAEGDEIDNALVTLVSGTKVFVQYRRSFRARLIQSDDEMKEYYNRLRSELLSYVGVKERVSWNYDSFNIGRRQFAKVNANRRSLILYLALSPDEIDEKYNFRDVSEKKRYAAVPVRYKITGSRSFKYATELIEQAAQKFGADFKRFEESLEIPYEDRDALIKKRLIRVYAKRETGETVTEEELEQYIEEGATVESLSAYTVTDQVSVNEAETLISDATAKQLVALAEEGAVRSAVGKRSCINLDTISANYKEGARVDLASLKERGLIDRKTASYKVLARGSLDKSLTIEANDFSLPAVKMIALTGGKVVKIRKN